MPYPTASGSINEREFLDQLYSSENQAFFVQAFHAIRDDVSGHDGPRFVAAKGYELDLAAFENMRSGRDFDLRLAGGAYRFDANSKNFYELFVNSVTGQIFVDGELSSSSVPYNVDDQGFVSFKINDTALKVQFNCERLYGEPVKPSFKGTISNPGKDYEASGFKYYPWGDLGDPIDDSTNGMLYPEMRMGPPPPPNTDTKKVKAAAAVISKAADKWVAVGFDFLSWKNKNTQFSALGGNRSTTPGGGGAGDKQEAAEAVGKLVVASLIEKYTGVKIVGSTAKAIEKKYAHFESKKITNYVRAGDIDPDKLKNPLEKMVNGLKDYELVSTERARTIRLITESLRRDYKTLTKEALLGPVKKEFMATHLLLPVEFLNSFDTAVGIKFDLDFGADATDRSVTNLYHPIDLALDNRVKRDQVPALQEQVLDLKNKWNVIQRQVGDEIKNLPNNLPADERSKREQEIRATYANELTKLKAEETEKTQKIVDAEEGGKNDKEFEERFKKAKDDVETNRQREREHQNAGK